MSVPLDTASRFRRCAAMFSSSPLPNRLIVFAATTDLHPTLRVMKPPRASTVRSELRFLESTHALTVYVRRLQTLQKLVHPQSSGSVLRVYGPEQAASRTVRNPGPMPDTSTSLSCKVMSVPLHTASRLRRCAVFSSSPFRNCLIVFPATSGVHPTP